MFSKRSMIALIFLSILFAPIRSYAIDFDEIIVLDGYVEPSCDGAIQKYSFENEIYTVEEKVYYLDGLDEVVDEENFDSSRNYVVSLIITAKDEYTFLDSVMLSIDGFHKDSKSTETKLIFTKEYFFEDTCRKEEPVVGEWVHKKDDTYYSVNGEYVTGIYEIDGHLYFFDKEGKLQTGFVTYEGKKYFFSRVHGYALSGWVRSDVGEGTWYQDVDGSLLVGVQNIEDHIYYFDKEGKLQTGFITYEGKKYFFSRTYEYALSGWVRSAVGEGTWYQGEDGSLLVGVQNIEDHIYYFDKNGKLQTGFITYEGKKYFFSRTYEYALSGWVRSAVGEGTWYQGEDGSLLVGVQNIEDHIYYFDKNGKLQTGFITYEGKKYFFSRLYEYALNGWVRSDVGEGTWYQGEDGSLLIGLQEIDDKNYYFDKNGKLKTGFVNIEDKTYYFDEAMVYGSIKLYGGTYTFDETGALIKIDYEPIYFNQRDPRWSGVVFELGTMGGSGCVPTSLAMAFSAILRREILPIEIANYLYYNTGTFNRWCAGADGYAIVYASDHYGVKRTPLALTHAALQEALEKGKIVYGTMGEGKFGSNGRNHAIIFKGYSDGMTYVYDPLNTNNNGWVSVDFILSQHATTEDDAWGGSYFHSLESFEFNL